MMKNTFSRIALSLGALTTALLVTAPPAAATPSCVAQTIQAEHEFYGTSWGQETVAFLATHPEVLQESGFRHIGDLVRFAASQDPAACPADL
ncbi:hypothetical protein [Jiangella asiatica]|uniref:Haemophore haem-binding domain-containing protein n=1 Tax=Jiangella asiatica TaxID=2530372 RepID=A0A4R5DVM5_9ACTN|nr:hypothetical protein [Jiangella asiatica]TDE15083.1 hypothetical protein E1269_02980 [Jiangella asiatica]